MYQHTQCSVTGGRCLPVRLLLYRSQLNAGHSSRVHALWSWNTLARPHASIDMQLRVTYVIAKEFLYPVNTKIYARAPPLVKVRHWT